MFQATSFPLKMVRQFVTEGFLFHIIAFLFPKGALFVPGLVIDSPDGAKFVHGEVIDTPEGPRVLPPDVRGDGNLEYCVQGFDINIEEARLLLGRSKSSGDVNDVLGGGGGACH